MMRTEALLGIIRNSGSGVHGSRSDTGVRNGIEVTTTWTARPHTGFRPPSLRAHPKRGR